MRSVNWLICALLTGVLPLLLFVLLPSKHFSSDMLSIFSASEETRRLKVYEEFALTQRLYVIVRGFSEDSRQKVKGLTEGLRQITGIKRIFYGPEMAKEGGGESIITGDFTPIPLSAPEVRRRLEGLVRERLDSPFYAPISREDPLGLFAYEYPPLPLMRDSILAIEGVGFLIIADLDFSMSDFKMSQRVSRDLENLTRAYGEEVLLFSPLLYAAESSSKIQRQSFWISILGALLLASLYGLILKNLRILLLFLMILGGSFVMGINLVLLFFGSIHLIILAFGVGISSLAADYLLHHYFKEYYRAPPRFSLEVAFGFGTTLFGFLVILLGVDFDFFRELALFAIGSLIFSYWMAAWVAVRLDLGLGSSQPLCRIAACSWPIPQWAIFLLSWILIGVGMWLSVLNFDPRALDVSHPKLEAARMLLEEQNRSTLLFDAPSKEALLREMESFREAYPKLQSILVFCASQRRANEVQNRAKAFDFKQLHNLVKQEAQGAGLAPSYFAKAYLFAQEESFWNRFNGCDEARAKVAGFEILENAGRFYSVAFYPELLKDVPWIFRPQLILQEESQAVFRESFWIFLVALMAIVGFLWVRFGRRALTAVNFILFPLGFSLFFVTLFGSGINLLHLFGWLMVVVICVDYGIYRISSWDVRSDHAIFFSLLTTVFGFGILAFSNIGALQSLGVAVLLSMVGVWILLQIKDKAS